MNKDKKTISTGRIVRILKRLSPWIVLCYIPYCLNIAGVISWRNNNPHHLRHLLDIIIDALNNDKVLDGLKLCLNEFIFNFTSIGVWIKFFLFLLVPIILLKIVILMLPYVPSMIKSIISTTQNISREFRNFKHSAKKINILEAIEYLLRYRLIPAYGVHNAIICLSTIFDDMVYLGGVKADNIKFPKFHLISYSGDECDYILDKPISIVQTSSGVFLCGSGLIDENETVQRKIKLSRATQTITIGKQTFQIFIEER